LIPLVIVIAFFGGNVFAEKILDGWRSVGTWIYGHDIRAVEFYIG
jgi:hypothetical protein